ncbi:MATE family efflux transporter [Actinoplanes sp. NPDC051851]|uniref:MATE family efflux transporter n=1 Tax=Actinoplanes sp. NPDC051851 TaxID=3154753 RepID=UPI0034415BCC
MAFVTSDEEREIAGPAPLISPAIRFAVSILVGLLAGLVLQVFTLAFLGRIGGDALYIRAIYTPIGFLVLAVTEGLVVAAQVSAGIATRSGRREILRPLPTFLGIGGGLLLLIAGAFAAASDPILTVVGVAPGQRPETLAFIVAVCLTSVVALVPYTGGALLRGIGRTVVSSALSVGFTVLSIVAMTVLGARTGLGVLAVPLATLIAGAVAGAAALVLLRAHAGRMSWFRRDAVAEVWAFGAPVAVTFVLLSSVNFCYLWVLRGAGAVEVAGFNLGQGANSIFMVVAIAVGSGAAIAVNLRPGEVRRPITRAGLSATVRIALPSYAVIGVLAYALRHPLSRLLTSDVEVARTTAGYFLWMGPTFVVFGGTLAVLTYLEQVGMAGTALLLNAVYFTVVMVIALLLPQPVGSMALTKLLAISNVIGFLTCWLSTRYLISRPRFSRAG